MKEYKKTSMPKSVPNLRQRRTMTRTARKTVQVWIFMAPALIMLGVFVFYPIVGSLPLMFFDYSVLRPAEFIGLENFRTMIHDEEFWIALKNSVLFVLVVPVIQILAIMLSFLVNRKLRGISFFRVLIYIPVVTSMVAVSIIWGFLFDRTGLINSILLELEWITKPLGFHNSSDTAMLCVMFVTIWQGLGYYMMLYLAGIQSIPSSLEDAAIVDGASSLQTMFKIKIPMLKPYIWFCSLNSIISAVGVFDVVYVLTEGGPNNATNVLNYYTYYNAFKKFRFGYAATVGAVQALITLLISIIVFVYGKKGGGMNYDS